MLRSFSPVQIRRIGLAGICLASFVGCIDFTIVNTAVPAIQEELGASLGEVQWIVTLFVMALSAFMVIAGRLADLLGRRKVLYAAMAVFAAASIGAGMASGIVELIAFRFVQGVSAAALYTATAAIVSDAFPEEERGRAIGTLFAANGIGLAVGPVLGGALVGFLSWRWVFFVNVPILLVSVLLCLPAIRESRDETAGAPIDWLGAALLTGGLFSVLLGLTHGTDWGWTSLVTLGSLIGGGGLLVSFVQMEARINAPLVQLELFTNPGFVSAGIATAALAFFYCSAFFLMPLYLCIVARFDSTSAGFLLLPTTAVVALSSPVVGAWVDRYGAAWPMAVGLMLMALSAGLQMQFVAETNIALVILAFAVMGLGWGCILGPATVIALASVPARFSGSAMGASWTLHNVGGALGLVLSTLTYRLSAARALDVDPRLPGPADPLLAAALVSEPTTAVRKLAGLGSGMAEAEAIVDAFFMAGYHAVMGLLFVVMLLALVAIAGLRRMAARMT